jgi:hypothetical protein
VFVVSSQAGNAWAKQMPSPLERNLRISAPANVDAAAMAAWIRTVSGSVSGSSVKVTKKLGQCQGHVFVREQRGHAG